MGLKIGVDKAVSRHRRIRNLVRDARSRAGRGWEKIETVDPLIIAAGRMFPYLPEQVRAEYARTALRVIRNSSKRQKETGVAAMELAGPSQTSILRYTGHR